MERDTLVKSIVGVVAVIMALIAGCSPAAPSGPDLPAGSFDLSEANNQTLAQVGDRFLALAGDGSVATAASALLAELQAGFAGVSSATLGTDGSTLFLTLRDGSVALLNTNRTVFGPFDSSLLAAGHAPVAGDVPIAFKAIHGAAARMLPGSSECPNQDTPITRNVLIINTAAVSSPSTDGYVQQIQDALIAHGWQPTEIDVRTRAGTGDRTFAPTSLTEVEGYGMVFIIAQGCVADPGGGVPHGYIQCCRPGSHTDVLSMEMAAELLGERDTGRLIRGETPAEGGGFVKDIYVRDDCLIERMRVTSGAMVYFIAPHSWSVASGLAAQGAGATLGWDGAFEGADGQRTVLGMLSRMTAANTWTTDEQAYANLMLSGLGLSHDPAGHATQARIAGTAGDFYLPAWGAFTVDTAEIPDDAVNVEVDVTYAACPDFALNFTMIVSDTVDTLRMPAGEATVAVKAFNAAGEIVGTGLQKVLLNGGRNDITLMTCKATVQLYPREYPESGVNAMARLRVEFVYPYTLRDAPPPVELNLSDIAAWSTEIWAGKLSVRSTALNAAGQAVGEQVREVEIACGNRTIDVCFGWARFEATRYPPGTASIQVVSDYASAPGPFTFAPGGSAEAYGFRVDGVVHFTAEARDASGSAIASVSETVTIACGENVVSFDLLNYGITVSADPTEIAADGREQSRITATLRYWQTGDTTAPSGPPVVGKSVLFGTTLGSLSGTNPATTDVNGQVTIQLSGTTSGSATVVASVAADSKEGKCLVQIGDPNAGQTLFVVYHGQGQQTPGANASVGARVKDAGGRGVSNALVRFRLLSGTVQLVEPLEVLTNEDGAAGVGVRSDGPAVGLVEVSVAGTALVKQCVAYLQFTCTLSRTNASLEIDNGELFLDVSGTANLASLGIPYQWWWHKYPRGGRLIRGGTDAVGASATLEAIPDATGAKLWRGAEPNTSMGITTEPACQVDGDWQALSWVPSPTQCLVEFYQNVVATIPVSIESRWKPVENSDYYQAKVVARFAGSGPAGNIRFIVSNPNDHGQVGGDWYDGSNRLASNSDSQISIIITQESYFETQAPDAWIAQKVQSYQDKYGGLSISVSAYPRTLNSGNVSSDPWKGW
ncbi:MAG: hypothetical protein JXA69_04345 [Phycisphaerae bacterium]|nr:hypothetical protein [Phycisphaerae bacterium]